MSGSRNPVRFTIAQASFPIPSTLSSRIIPIWPAAISRASSSVGMRCPLPASSRCTCSSDIASDKPGFIGGAIDGVVMQQDEMAVVGFPQIHFNEIRMERSGFPDSGEGIFRGVAGSSPMTDAKGGSDSDLV